MQYPQLKANTPELEESFEQKAERFERIRNNRRSKILGIPLRFRSARLENFEGHTVFVDSAKKAIAENKGAFFHGGIGTGKTHLACGLMRFWYEEPRLGAFVPERPCPLFISSVELFLELKETFDRRDVGESDVLFQYSENPFLVIDDVGSEKVSEWSRQMFYALINRRYMNLKQTVITSNLTLEEISSKIDDRISSRIIEMCKITDFGDEDYRVKMNQKEVK